MLTDRVGNFLRVQIPIVLKSYRKTLQDIVDDENSNAQTRKEFNSLLLKLSVLSEKWHSAYSRYGIAPAGSAKEQQQIEKAVLNAEKELSKEFRHIFDLSYYIPVIRKSRREP